MKELYPSFSIIVDLSFIILNIFTFPPINTLTYLFTLDALMLIFLVRPQCMFTMKNAELCM